MRCSLLRTTVFTGSILTGSVLALSLAMAPVAGLAQQPAANPPPAETPQTVTPPPAETPKDGAQNPAPVAPTAPAAPAVSGDQPEAAGATAPEAAPFPDLTAVPTLVPMPKDPPEAQEVEIPAKPVAIVSGDSTWDDSVVKLGDAFKKINEALEKAGKKPAGRPVAVFTKSTDDGFSFDAMIPLEAAPATDAAPLGDGIRYGIVPAGKALRFIHKDPYELISMTYEGVALYMENKNLVGKEDLIEEYVTDISDQADKNTIVNIYVELVDKEPAKN